MNLMLASARAACPEPAFHSHVQPPAGWTFVPPPPPPPRRRNASQRPAGPFASCGPAQQPAQCQSAPSSATGSDRACEGLALQQGGLGEPRRSLEGSLNDSMVHQPRPTSESMQDSTYAAFQQDIHSHLAEVVQRLEQKLYGELTRVEAQAQNGYRHLAAEMGELKEQNRLLRDNCTALELHNSRLQQYILHLQGQGASLQPAQTDTSAAPRWDQPLQQHAQGASAGASSSTNAVTGLAKEFTQPSAPSLPAACAVAAAGLAADRRAVPRVPHTHGDIW